MSILLARSLADELAEHPYAWPGGYPRYAITDDGEALCVNCIRTERAAIDHATPGDGWFLLSLAINWESSLHCAHCDGAIESAYGDADNDLSNLPASNHPTLSAADCNPSMR
jgi:hypothetical protein